MYNYYNYIKYKAVSNDSVNYYCKESFMYFRHDSVKTSHTAL